MNADFNSVRGLLGFATFLATCSWILQSAVYSRNNTILSVQKIYTVIAVLMGAGCFFCLCAVSVFAGAGIKTAFCAAFDSDSAFNGLYCGYADGFYAAVAGVILSLLQTLLFWFWMPHDELEDIPEKEAAIGGAGGYAGFGGAATTGGEAVVANSDGGYNSSL